MPVGTVLQIQLRAIEDERGRLVLNMHGVWRSRDLAAWESLGSPYTLKDGIWYQTERALFDKVPETQWRVWAPELHFLGNRWAIAHTTPQHKEAVMAFIEKRKPVFTDD